MSNLPGNVVSAQDIARAVGFAYSCDDRVGRLLSLLTAAVSSGGRILELGTGVGVGTAWLVHGLGGRTDVELMTVETDPNHVALVAAQTWPGWVTIRLGDAVELLPTLGRFDLIFADAPGGKWEGLDLTIAALKPGGTLMVDDMTLLPSWSKEQATKQEEVRRTLLGHPELTSCELDWATGVMLSTRSYR